MASYIEVDNLNVSDYVEVWECNCSENGRQVVMAVDDLHYLPTVDVREVKHGKWLNKVNGYYWFGKCSECGASLNLSDCSIHMNYCPNCGAKMDKESDKE